MKILQIGEKVIRADELLALLNRYQLTPQLVRNLIVDQEIFQLSCTEAERAAALEAFCQQQQLSTPVAQQTWLDQQGLTPADLEKLALRPLLAEKFKMAQWGNKVESYFLAHKSNYDRVIYSLLRTKDLGVAQEAYFRIQEAEQSFSDLAQEHSQGPEASSGGVVGPMSLKVPHPAIARTLAISQPGQLWPPTRLEEWFLVVRLEKFFPAQLDESLRRRILNELFEDWLASQIQQVGPLRQLSPSLTPSA